MRGRSFFIPGFPNARDLHPNDEDLSLVIPDGIGVPWESGKAAG
jgi:hypothetical protein